MIEFIDEIKTVVEELGGTDAAGSALSVNPKTLASWITGKGDPTLKAVLTLMDYKPELKRQFIIDLGGLVPVPDSADKDQGKGDGFGLDEEPDPSPENVLGSELAATVPDVQRLLELTDRLRPKVRLDNPPTATVTDILQAVLDGKWTRRIVLMMPCNKDVPPSVHFNQIAIAKKHPWLGYQQRDNTVIQRARNEMVQNFLKSEAEWSLWVDADMVLPFGDPGFFLARMRTQNFPPEFAALDAVDRLTSHGKSIVGGVYARRDSVPGLCIQPDMTPRHAGDKGLVDRLRKGPFNDLVEVDYIATGCALVHRQVYLDIQKKRPDLAPPEGSNAPWNLFGHDIGKEGEDMAFFKLAKEAGHQSFLDTGLWAGHVGRYCFMP